MADRCEPIREQITAIEGDIIGLQADLAAASPPQKPSIAAAIVNQERQLAARRLELSHCESAVVLNLLDQDQLSPRLYLGDVDGDGAAELIAIDGLRLVVYKTVYELTPVLTEVFASPVKRLIVGDFVNHGREHGRDQICVILEDGTLQGFAISDDLKSLWWWFTQGAFLGDDEAVVVGDFDGDGAEEIFAYKPSTGGLRLFSKVEGGGFGQTVSFLPGNLAGFDLVNKEIQAGDFGQAVGRKDFLVVDHAGGRIMRFDSVTDATGAVTFWWAYTTATGVFAADDQVCVANLGGGDRDGVMIRDAAAGGFRLFAADGATLTPTAQPTVGQLPVKPRAGRVVAAKVRDAAFRGETGGRNRDDVVYFDEASDELIRVDARFDGAAGALTYWWAFTTHLAVEPAVAAVAAP